MRIQPRRERVSTARLEQAFFDWMKKLMQLAAVGLAVLAGYLVWGIVSGGIGSWDALGAAAQARIGANVQQTLFYFNLTLGVLLLTSAVIYYDEESLGYILVVAALGLYFGTPFLVESMSAGQVEAWQQSRNVPMLALYHEARVAALILILPGVALSLYDIVQRALMAGRGERAPRTAMKYGGATEEIAPAGNALIGVMATCWQLPFCREALRVRCPIYHLKRRCWRERVGCMCDEVSIRESLSRFFDKPEKTGNLDFATGLDAGQAAAEGSSVRTGKQPEIVRMPEIRRDQIRIPNDTRIPMSVKRQRCRECIIYNEHQRLKYQFLGPIVTLIVPALAALKFEYLMDTLKHALSSVDQAMARLSFDPQVREVGLASATSSSDVANIIMIACLVIMATTMALRALEYAIFTLKL